MFVLVPVLGIEGRLSGDFHPVELMPGMVVMLQNIEEEALLDFYLPCNEELAILQAGTDLFLNFFNEHEGAVGEDRFAMSISNCR